MRKSSLGRRNSNRPSSAAAGRTSVDINNARKSGIPVSRQQRPRSTERQSVSNMNFLDRMQRTHSVHNLPGSLMTPARTPLSSRALTSGGTERPARTTSYGTPSVSFGSSSIGGQKNKRDTRPLQDKEWQAKAVEFIEDVVVRHPDGVNVLGGSLKPLTLTKFLDVCDLLFKMLHPTISINKANYTKELPFLLQKKMSYKGKVEKSWMIVVSTPHAMPFAIGLLEFLAHCVYIRCNVDIDSLMFPPKFDGISTLSEMNFELLIPYLTRSFEFMKANRPNYAAEQEELDNDILQKHYEQEDGLNKKDTIVSELMKIEGEYEKITHDRNLIVQQNQALQNEYRSIEQSIKQDEEKMAQCKIAIPSYHTELAEIERKSAAVIKEGEKLAEEQELLQKKAREQPITHRDVENMKKKRDSIDREIVSSKKYIKSYQDMIFQEDMDIVQLKNEIEELTRETNLKAATYVPVEPKFEMLVLPTKMEEVELTLREEDFATLNTKYSNLSAEYKAARSAADKERAEAEKLTNEQKASITARHEKLLVRKTQWDADVARLNNERQAKEEQLERTKFEVEALEKQEKHLRAKIDVKKELVAKEKRDLEEGRALMLEGISHLEQKVEEVRKEREIILRSV